MTDTPEIQRLKKAKRRTWERRRRRLLAAGEWAPHVDSTRAREHIAGLEAYGISRPAIGKLAQVHGRIIERIVQGQGRIHRTTEEAILKARFDLDLLGPSQHLHASGTQRRLQALARIGYGLHDLGPLLGVSFTNLSRIRAGETVFVYADTARKVRDVYARLSMTLGPSPRAAAHAKRTGWPPPWAWDDETIDHPATLPDLACLRAPGGPRRSEDTLEDVQWILHHEDGKATVDQVAARLGVTKDGITRALKRVEESRTVAYREAVLGAAEGPLTWDQTLELAQDLVEVFAVRERFYANAEAAGQRVTVRVAS